MINELFIDFANGKKYNIINITLNNHIKEERNMTSTIGSSAIEISKTIIAYCNNNDISISNLKLQKILYYVQGYCLKKHGVPAFNESIYNWPYGPVVPDVYYEYNEFGSRSIYLPPEDAVPPKLNQSLQSIITNVLLKCTHYSAYQLVDKTHNETPWINSARGREISTDLIHMFFTNNNPLGIDI